MNRKSNPCNENSDYNFQVCVRNSLVQRLGCRLPWDMWSAEDYEPCNRTEQLEKFDKKYRSLSVMYLDRIVEDTGCVKPCRYNHYKLKGEVSHQAKKFPGFVAFNFAGEDLEVEREVESYSLLSLLSDIGGSLGLFLGFSLLMLWDAIIEACEKIKNLIK